MLLARCLMLKQLPVLAARHTSAQQMRAEAVLVAAVVAAGHPVPFLQQLYSSLLQRLVVPQMDPPLVQRLASHQLQLQRLHLFLPQPWPRLLQFLPLQLLPLLLY